MNSFQRSYNTCLPQAHAHNFQTHLSSLGTSSQLSTVSAFLRHLFTAFNKHICFPWALVHSFQWTYLPSSGTCSQLSKDKSAFLGHLFTAFNRHICLPQPLTAVNRRISAFLSQLSSQLLSSDIFAFFCHLLLLADISVFLIH